MDEAASICDRNQFAAGGKPSDHALEATTFVEEVVMVVVTLTFDLSQGA